VTYEAFDVVTVPFPFTDRTASKRRPALVLSRRAGFGDLAGHSVMAMITSAAGQPWPLDVPLRDRVSTGLGVDCVVRMKLFTLDHALVIRKIGQLARSDQARVRAALRLLLPK
jgi:mRNA interferase MazF